MDWTFRRHDCTKCAKKSRSGKTISFKTFDLAHDVASLQSAINEVVVVSSSLFITGSGDLNVKFYQNIATGSGDPAAGGYWQTVFDSAPTSSQATGLFDLAFGFASASTWSRPAPTGSYSAEKTKVYREIASVLLGDPDATFAPSTTGTAWTECFFFLVKRGLMKDELKKGTVNVYFTGTQGYLTASDSGAASAFKQTVGGDYAPLFSGTVPVGLVYYNAGIIVVPASGVAQLPWNPVSGAWSGTQALSGCMISKSLDSCVDGLRAHTDKLSFNNQTNLYSTVYFCRATNTEFNYSSNPTYVDPATQRILVTSGSNVLQSRTYITTIGLYDANDNLLAVGKLSEPITKSPDTEAIFRIRLDY